MSKTHLDVDLEAELEGVEDSDEDMDKDDKDEEIDKDILDEDDDDEFDEITLAKISSLEDELSANPFNYTAYTDLIDILRTGSDFTKLRSVREKFRSNYPLSAQLWIDWTQDEMKIAASEEDKQMVVDLFEAGVKDYVSVDLWLEYCKFYLGEIGTEEGIKKARDVFERSLISCGLHTGKASLLWDSYREFEVAILAMKGGEEKEKQKARIINLMKRQLRVPLLDMNNTLAEYQVLIQGDPDPNVTRDFHKAKEKLAKIETYEISVLNKDDTLEAYKEYLQFELKAKDPARIQMLYERAITDNCLNSSLWEEYLAYLDTNLKIDTVCLPVYRRAVRNCPWSANLWSDYMLSLERFEKDHGEILKVFEESLAVGFGDPASYLEIWLTYVTYMRRRTAFDKEKETETMTDLRKAFDHACQHLIGVNGADPDSLMLKFYANIEADQFRNLENARKIWADVLQAHQFEASVWIEAIEFEKIFGDKKHLRKRLERALEKSHDNPEAIAKLWMQFEREEGSLESYDHCRKMVKQKLERIERVRDKEAAGRDQGQERDQAKVEKKKEKDKQHRRDKRHQASEAKKFEKTEVEPKMEPQQPAEFKVPGLPGSGSGKRTSSSSTEQVTDLGVDVKVEIDLHEPMETAKKRVEPPPGYLGPSLDGPTSKRQKLDDGADSGQTSDEDRNKATVFLSNLDFEVDEDAISSLMGCDDLGLYDDVVDDDDDVDDYQHQTDYLLQEPQQDQEFTIKKSKSGKSGIRKSGKVRMKNRLKGRVCSVCGDRLKNEATLNKHLRDKHEIQGEVHSCEFCGQQLRTKGALFIHLKKNHDVQGDYNCDICNQTFFSRLQLKRHENDAHSSNPVSCEHCSEMFPSKDRLTKHIRNYHREGGSGLKPKSCIVCGEIIYGTLAKHMTTHRVDGKIPCSKCNLTFNGTSNLKRHMLELHEEKEKISCLICDSKFIRRSSMVKHLKLYHQKISKEDKKLMKKKRKVGVKSKNFKKPRGQCNLCGMEMSKSGIFGHQKKSCPARTQPVEELKKQRLQERAKTFRSERATCNLCGSEMAKRSISRHQKDGNCPATIQAKERVKCNLCGNEMSKASLNFHQRKNCKASKHQNQELSPLIKDKPNIILEHAVDNKLKIDHRSEEGLIPLAIGSSSSGGYVNYGVVQVRNDLSYYGTMIQPQ